MLTVVVMVGVSQANSVGGHGRDRAPTVPFVDPNLDAWTQACERTYGDSIGCSCLAMSVRRDFGQSGAETLWPRITRSRWSPERAADVSAQERDKLDAIFSECGIAVR